MSSGGNHSVWSSINLHILTCLSYQTALPEDTVCYQEKGDLMLMPFFRSLPSSYDNSAFVCASSKNDLLSQRKEVWTIQAVCMCVRSEITIHKYSLQGHMQSISLFICSQTCTNTQIHACSQKSHSCVCVCSVLNPSVSFLFGHIRHICFHQTGLKLAKI